METLSTDLRDELIAALQRLIAHTEEIYLNLARQFPLLLSEMDRSFSNSRAMATNVQRSSRIDADNRKQITGIDTLVADTRRLIESGSETFQKMHRQDEQLFAALDQGIHKLSSLDEVIGRIKEDSIEMELISLNAMTVALKAGSAGRAFSYITEELKRLSSRTISLTDEITRRGEQLLRVFHDFRESLAGLKKFQERLFGELRDRLDQSFQAFREGVQRTNSVLTHISEQSSQIREPLHLVMEEIQLQDIIKQSVDHVILALRELSAASTFETTEERLDELAFYQQLPELGHVLLEDVAEKIERSISVFRTNVSRARSTITELEQERSSFVTSALSKAQTAETKDTTSLTVLFDSSTTVLRELLGDLSRSLTMKQQLADRSRSLMKEVAKLEEDFKSFSIVINRFHSIDIASRIEVVKQAVLQKMSGTVDEMTALTDRIEKDVAESLDSIKAFIKTISSTVSEFRKVFQEEETFVSQFEKSIRSMYDQLFQEKNTLTDTISGFSLFTGSFLTLFDSTSQDLGRLEILVSDVQDIRGKLDEIKQMTRKEMEPLMKEKGVDSWEIGNQKLQSIIARFTIFTHKKKAGQIAGFEVEAGAESGTVTLF